MKTNLWCKLGIHHYQEVPKDETFKVVICENGTLIIKKGSIIGTTGIPTIYRCKYCGKRYGVNLFGERFNIKEE